MSGKDPTGKSGLDDMLGNLDIGLDGENEVQPGQDLQISEIRMDN